MKPYNKSDEPFWKRLYDKVSYSKLCKKNIRKSEHHSARQESKKDIEKRKDE